MSIVSKEFKVVAVSENTNSFGLREMVMVAKDGSAFKGCFNYLNVKKRGESILGEVTLLNGKELNTTFRGGELVHEIDNAPREVVEEIFN